MTVHNLSFLHVFKSDITGLEKPTRFTFPFCYDPDRLSLVAADELQTYLTTQKDFVHNFGLQPMDGLVIGKMFGVLVVEAPDGTLGFLAACSGKLAGTNQHRYFVPPVFDMLSQDSFFLKEEKQLNAFNRHLENLESDPALPAHKQQLALLQAQSDNELKSFRAHMKQEKALRKEKREQAKSSLSESAYDVLAEDLIKQSYRDQYEYAVLKDNWKTKLGHVEQEIQRLQHAIDCLRETRKAKSSALQQRLFKQYQFLNAEGKTKSLLAIFQEATQLFPPAGAGECAAPKLLQYAYLHNLKPISMAEFWWGASPSSEVRRHRHFYPACKSKCEPILSHMLQGLVVDPNPMLSNPAQGRDIEILYEDTDIIVVNKPEEFLSVPGVHIQDSVYTRILERYPDISGPVVIHRLDMSTSGILILAKNKEAHKFIQDQFIRHTVIKRYTALLAGEIHMQNGLIDLPLRVDLDDRPRQVVCYDYGKPAQTRFEVVAYENGNTRIHFYPLTGRTHQLRVHAAHKHGLNQPIVGDDLYGQRSKRLHLHAGYIQFIHPTSHEKVTFEIPDPF